MAGAVLRVPDEHLPVVLNPALATQDVVNAGRHLVPLKVVPKPERDRAWRGAAGRPWGTSATLSWGMPVSSEQVMRVWERNPGVLVPAHGPSLKDDIFIKESSLPRKYSANTSPSVEKAPEGLSHRGKNIGGSMSLGYMPVHIYQPVYSPLLSNITYYSYFIDEQTQGSGASSLSATCLIKQQNQDSRPGLLTLKSRVFPTPALASGCSSPPITWLDEGASNVVCEQS